MSTILVTGASGFVARAVIEVLRPEHEIVTLSRSRVDTGAVNVRGDFAQPGDLMRVDGGIDVVVHLGGVTGAASEADALSVNVSGTATLLRHFRDRGVRRFVIASSIAAAGCLGEAFLPRRLPIPDDHPCDSTNAYGLSKFFVEELARYLHRRDAAAELTLLRLGVVVRDDAPVPTKAWLAGVRHPFAALGAVTLGDAARAIATAATTALGAGVRVANVVAPWARTPVPTGQALRTILGARAASLDLSLYEDPRHDFAGVYDTTYFRGLFAPGSMVDPRTMTPRGLTDAP